MPDEPKPRQAPAWLQARLEQDVGRREGEGLIRQYRDERGRLFWAITAKGERRLAGEDCPDAERG
jgi:hypothetical protein